MSLAPKIDEVQEFLLRSDISLGFITETWLKETIADSAVHIPGNTIIQKDEIVNNHGGVCFCPPQDFGPEAKTRGGTLGFPVCIHVRNFKNAKI